MRLTVRAEVNMKTKEIKARATGFNREFAETIGTRAAELAREAVSPGAGPGPHPHRPDSPHEDTGDLAASVQMKLVHMGFLETAHIFTDLEYGLYLEAGWTTKAGTHWRYPWLMPSLEMARDEAETIARSTARRWFSEEGAPQRGRVDFEAPLSATLEPEMG